MLNSLHFPILYKQIKIRRYAHNILLKKMCNYETTKHK